ncbi:MAG: RDD family protein [Acidimicrobiales bacterium]|nr:RDD family protein [Acidimicrobiales bacterium]
MASWWYLTAGQPTGPVNDEQLCALALSGALSPTSPVFRDGDTEWAELSAFEGALGLPRNTWGSYFVTPSTERQGERGGLATKPATAWRRYWASFLDNLMLGFLAMVLAFLVAPLARGLTAGAFLIVLWTAYVALILLYEIVSTAVRGQTPGKLANHLEVAVADTLELPDLSRSALRSLVKAITQAIPPLWWISVLLILVTKRRTGLHDLVAGTVVQEAPY